MNKKEKHIYDLVRSELREDMIPKAYQNLIDSKWCGHCHHASLAMYNLLGGKEAGYRLQTAVDELDIKHYWLVNKEGEIIDPTVGQYTDLGREPPYDRVVSNRASHQKSNATKEIIQIVSKKVRSTI